MADDKKFGTKDVSGTGDGMSIRELVRFTTGSVSPTKSTLEDALRGKGYREKDVRRMGRAWGKIENNPNRDFILHGDDSFSVTEGGQKISGSGTAKGNVKGFDIGDLIGLGRDVSTLAGAMQREILPLSQKRETDKATAEQIVKNDEMIKDADFDLFKPDGFDLNPNFIVPGEENKPVVKTKNKKTKIEKEQEERFVPQIETETRTPDVDITDGIEYAPEVERPTPFDILMNSPEAQTYYEQELRNKESQQKIEAAAKAERLKTTEASKDGSVISSILGLNGLENNPLLSGISNALDADGDYWNAFKEGFQSKSDANDKRIQESVTRLKSEGGGSERIGNIQLNVKPDGTYKIINNGGGSSFENLLFNPQSGIATIARSSKFAKTANTTKALSTPGKAAEAGTIGAKLSSGKSLTAFNNELKTLEKLGRKRGVLSDGTNVILKKGIWAIKKKGGKLTKFSK